MIRSMPSAPPSQRSLSRRQRDGGYLLLAILLMMAFMIIAATIEAPRMVQQMKRDREEELIHRGTEYARAIKKFYKKTGRYPATLDDLDKGQVRYLRKRYKDPLTKDGKWKLLNYGDIQSLLNNNAPGTPAAALGSQGQSTLGQSPGQTGSPATAVSQSVQVTDPSQQQQQQPQMGGNLAGGAATGGQQGTSPFASTFSLGSSSSSSNQPGGTGSSAPGNSPFGQNTTGGTQTFGGGAIVGVGSVSKDPTIRIYNKKKTYDEWQFIYNPIMDQANVLLRGPYQPTTIGGAQIGIPAGQMSQPQTVVGQPPGSGSGQQQPQPPITPQQAPSPQ
jgi:type II secretory pathway pseudopilin PulG